MRMIFFYLRLFKMKRPFLKTAAFCVLAVITAGFGEYMHQNGKVMTLKKGQASSGFQSTGAASVYYTSGRAAEFTGHHFLGLRNPNALYQGFLAVHFDEMDSLLTFHSAVGRTNAKNNPGDKNTYQWIGSTLADNITQFSEQMKFGVESITDRFIIKEIIETKKDSSHVISVSFVFEFYRPASDTVTFSNMRLLFGYDGDIGNSLGGFSDDSSGYYEDDSTAIVYVFDDSLHFYSGIILVNKQANATPGNFSSLHRVVNRDGASEQDLDSLLYRLMTQAAFYDSIGRTDVSVYWSVDLGTITPQDTVRDTVRFELVNGATRNALIAAAKKNSNESFHTEFFPVKSLPSSLKLYSNYPNPFNPSTTIRFDLDRAGFISLKIYNILGQEVRLLHRGHMPAGSYHVDWDGKNDHGLSVSSGVYIYNLQTMGKTLSRKMILMK